MMGSLEPLETPHGVPATLADQPSDGPEPEAPSMNPIEMVSAPVDPVPAVPAGIAVADDPSVTHPGKKPCPGVVTAKTSAAPVALLVVDLI